MKKFLTLAVFLLTLLPTARVSAQNWVNESMHECEDDGFTYMTDLPCEGFVDCRDQCSSCNGFFDCDEIEEHEKDCFYECNKCNQKMKVIEREKHKCKGNTPETDQDQDNDRNKGDDQDQNKDSKKDEKSPGTDVSRPIHEQNLPNVTVNGKNKSGSPLNWWDWTYVIGGGGNGSSNNSGNGTVSAVPEEEQPLRASQQSSGKTNSIGYHRCPCMITAATKDILNKLKEHRLYNQDGGYPGLTKDLERQLAFPETIQQGNNGTCAAAALQKFLAENFPEKYADCVYNLANYGRYEPWGLKYDFLSKGGNPFGITQDQLDAENVDTIVAKNLGNQYTSVDALMQSAIQSWANSNSEIERSYINLVDYILNSSYSLAVGGVTFHPFGYDPREDNGDVGGMTFRDVEKFITENICDESSLVHKNKSKSITYDYLNDALFDYADNDLDSYTVLASVDIVQDKNGKHFGKGSLNHMIEISGTKSGKIDFWSYGNNYTTSENYCSIGELMIIKKTDYAKKEKKDRQALACHCNDCSGDGCSKCMSK